jgi:hypothetical protein
MEPVCKLRANGSGFSLRTFLTFFFFLLYRDSLLDFWNSWNGTSK